MPTPRRPKAPILIVEDKDSLRAMLRHALEEQGHSVVEAADEAEALRQVRDTRPDLVLSDLRLLSGDGVGVLRGAKDIDPELPVIVMTAYSDLDSAVAAFQGGAYEYLPKPFDVDQAVELIRRALDESRRCGPVVVGGVRTGPGKREETGTEHAGVDHAHPAQLHVMARQLRTCTDEDGLGRPAELEDLQKRRAGGSTSRCGRSGHGDVSRCNRYRVSSTGASSIFRNSRSALSIRLNERRVRSPHTCGRKRSVTCAG
jgi:DNA-binding response OmpR family regulator